MHSIDNNKALDLTDRKDASRSHRLRVPAHPLACCLDPRRQPPHIRGRAPPAPRARYLEEERDIAAVVLAAREAFFCPDHLDLARVLPGDAHACVVAVLVDADDHLRRARKVGTAPSCGPRRQCSALARADPRATSAAESAATRGHVCMRVRTYRRLPAHPPLRVPTHPSARACPPFRPPQSARAWRAGAAWVARAAAASSAALRASRGARGGLVATAIAPRPAGSRRAGARRPGPRPGTEHADQAPGTWWGMGAEHSRTTLD